MLLLEIFMSRIKHVELLFEYRWVLFLMFIGSFLTALIVGK